MTVTVTPTVELSNNPPRVRLNVAASAGEASATVTRLDPDGNTVVVRTSDGAALPLPGGSGLVYDYEPPYGQLVSFSSLESPATVSAEVSVGEARVWLVHPGVPELSMPVELDAGSLAEEAWDVQQSVLKPMGRKFPVVRTDGQRQAPASSVTVFIDSLDELAALRALTSDAGTLLLNIPAGLNLGVDTGYIAVGPIRNRRLSDIGADPYRSVELPFQTVERPVGGSQSQRTYADVLADNATYASLLARYPTYLTLLAGP